MTNLNQTFHALARQQQASANGESVYTVGEAGRVVNRSASTIRRLAIELKITPQRTAGMVRIFSAAQVRRIADELQRRELENDR